MKVEKVFCIERKYPEDFDKEIIDYLVNNYGCDRDMADIRLHNCLLLDGLYVKVQKDLLEYRLIITEAK